MTPLRRRMIADMQIRNLATRTQEVYVERVAEFARFHGRAPSELHIDHVRGLLAHLGNDKRVSRSYLPQSVAALRFLYRPRPPRGRRAHPLPGRSRSLPTVLTRPEIVRLLDATVSLKHRAIFTVCYSAGLRVSEATHLHLDDTDRDEMLIHVRSGKGGRGRHTVLAQRLLPTGDCR
jgi:integrase/recombinase XerD